MLPKYREVQYIEDGVVKYQCLSCYQAVCVPGGIEYWNYCPVCGIPWEEKLECRPHGMPKWEWLVRQGKLSLKPDPPFNMLKEHKRGWVIESRTRLINDVGWGAWNTHWVGKRYGRETNALDAIRILRVARNLEPISEFGRQNEWRAVISDYPQSYNYPTIPPHY